ncbi:MULTISPECIES: alpha/beta hydrolase [Arthrobacter]|uniref:Alpha/beta hydrolase n=2 Tax=Arthrobacter TaxID=1663 RepID=A0ABU9KIP2_9MICC|nr:alpha/beta hydrolase [Arthrobacter sp. YJM1]MDP5227001.1 alpha/beta hydrolase [Arthrobacter sp. YJM1]
MPTSDGLTLAMDSYGEPDAGRGLVVVGGAFLTAALYRPFAQAFVAALNAEDDGGWAVHVYDRRGRGGSPEQGPDYGMDTEVADLLAVLEHTGARHVLGHSLGGAVALNTARHLGPALEGVRLSVYDPAVNIDGSAPVDWLPAFAQAVNDGDVPRALARMRRGMLPGTVLARAPEPLLALLFTALSRTKANRVFADLMPSAVGELKAALEEEAHAADFADLATDTAIFYGARSPAYFRATAERLHTAVPGPLRRVPRCVHGSVPAVGKRLVSALAEFHVHGTSAGR